jgi:hypothetical protein
MQRSTFLAFKGLVSIVFALGLILLPAPLMSIFGMQLNPMGAFIARLFGVDMLGIGLVCWFSRRASGALVLDILLGLFAADAVGSIIMIAGQLSGMMNALGWANVVLWLFLTLGVGYYRFAGEVAGDESYQQPA